MPNMGISLPAGIPQGNRNPSRRCRLRPAAAELRRAGEAPPTLTDGKSGEQGIRDIRVIRDSRVNFPFQFNRGLRG
jgi:hypothetical protein